MTVQVYKISGSDLDDATFSARFATGMADVARGGAHTIVVHGGGKELTELMAAMKIETQFIDGLRVTFGPARDAALMIMSGLANKRLTAALLAAGADAVGLSGVDGGLVRVAPVSPALGFVGRPTRVRAELLSAALARGILPVINPMSLGEDGQIYNVNADHVAGAIATAMDASMLTFVTNVPGVMDAGKRVIPRLTASEARAMIADGTIFGGMIPKVSTALDVLAAGVQRVRICSLDGLADGGTIFASTEPQS